MFVFDPPSNPRYPEMDCLVCPALKKVYFSTATVNLNIFTRERVILNASGDEQLPPTTSKKTKQNKKTIFIVDME